MEKQIDNEKYKIYPDYRDFKETYAEPWVKSIYDSIGNLDSLLWGTQDSDVIDGEYEVVENKPKRLEKK